MSPPTGLALRSFPIRWPARRWASNNREQALTWRPTSWGSMFGNACMAEALRSRRCAKRALSVGRSSQTDLDMMTPEPSSRQTLTYLRNLMDSRRIRPKNKLGQNLLIDLNLLTVIVRTAELTREDLVLEVGSGTGGLTTRLAEQAGAVL